MNQMELEQTLSRLQTTVDRGFSALSTRMDRAEELQLENHTENSTRLDNLTDRIADTNGLVGKAHDRVSKTEAFVHVLQVEMEKARVAIHDLAKALQAKMFPSVPGELKDRAVTMVEARWLIGLIISCTIAGAAFTIWVLKITGKLG